MESCASRSTDRPTAVRADATRVISFDADVRCALFDECIIFLVIGANNIGVIDSYCHKYNHEHKYVTLGLIQ